MLQSASEHAIFIKKLKIFWGGPPHRRLRRLDPRAFGAQPK